MLNLLMCLNRDLIKKGLRRIIFWSPIRKCLNRDLIKKGLRRAPPAILGVKSVFESRPDKEGIKTREIEGSSFSWFESRPDKEGIKTSVST